jgi:hypothetical protein
MEHYRKTSGSVSSQLDPSDVPKHQLSLETMDLFSESKGPGDNLMQLEMTQNSSVLPSISPKGAQTVRKPLVFKDSTNSIKQTPNIMFGSHVESISPLKGNIAGFISPAITMPA